MILRVAAILVFLGQFAFGGELWFHELRDGVYGTPVAPAVGQAGDKYWLAAEFRDDPATVELDAVRDARGYQRVTLVFNRSVSPALSGHYLELARGWNGAGVRGELKFVGSLPTESEMEILKPVCDLGVKIYFFTALLPTPYEAANVQSLKGCVEVAFAIGRYFKSEEIPDVKRLSGLPLLLANDYYPTYPHVDHLNRLDNALALQVTGLPPTAEQVQVINKVKNLASLYVNLDRFPGDGEYDGLASLNRAPQARLAIRWGFGTPRDSDLDAWESVRPDRLIVPVSFLDSAQRESRLRALNGEVTVEISDPWR